MPSLGFIYKKDFNGIRGFLPLHSPEDFDACSEASTAYLFAHDLLEHGLITDASHAGELAASGACLHIRGENYFYSYSFVWYKGEVDRVITDLSTEVAAVLDLDRYANYESEYFDSNSVWAKKALRAVSRNRKCHEVFEEVWQAISQGSLIAKVRHNLSTDEEVEASRIQEFLELGLGYVILGYRHARQRFKTDRMHEVYREITQHIQTLLGYEDYWYEGQKFTIHLNSSKLSTKVTFDYYDYDEDKGEVKKRYSLDRFYQTH